MKTSARLVLVLTLVLAARPAPADVVPARPPEPTPEETAIASQLVRQGASPRAAADRASELTMAEQEFFAADLSRLHPAGAQQDMFAGQTINLWYETLAGALMLGAGVGAAYYMIHLNE